MSENGEAQYVQKNSDDTVTILQDGYINEDNIEIMKFTFAEPAEITEGVADKNAKNKQPVTYTRKGRSAYSPSTTNYPDGSASSKVVFGNCVIQYTEALKSPNHKYARNFVIIGLQDAYIHKITTDAKNESGINLAVKPNTASMNQHYWLRCNLDKLSKKDTHILLEAQGGQSVEMDLDTILTEMKESVHAYITFTLSASMNNNNMDEELDMKDGQYYITMKPTEVFVTKETDIQGPVLQDTNNRRNEKAELSGHFFAGGKLAEMAMKRLRISK